MLKKTGLLLKFSGDSCPYSNCVVGAVVGVVGDASSPSGAGANVNHDRAR